jgi:ABC-type Zn uptake system ZnuABC Zn-binding protein ZnuA
MDIRQAGMLVAGIVLLAGCGAAPQKPTGRLTVVTTIGVLADWARQVGGDRVEVTSLLTGNESPHTYEAKPHDAALLARADILFRVGLGLEDWLDPVVANAGNKKLVIVDASAGVKDVITETEHEPKSEARSEKPEARTSESESPAPSPQPLAPASGNPHIWLDPELAKTGIANLVKELVKLDPKGESLYRRREAGFREQLDSLMTAINRQVATLPDKRFVSFHEAWPYFARRFGFTIVATVEPIPGQEPSARELARLVDLIRRERIRVITTEPQLPSSLPEMLAKETGAKLVSLNPLEYEGGYIVVLGTSTNALINALR